MVRRNRRIATSLVISIFVAAPALAETATERAEMLERTRCDAASERIVAPILSGEAIDDVEAIHISSMEDGTPVARLYGAKLAVKTQPNVTAEILDRALECHAARRVLGRSNAAVSPNDPLALGVLVEVEVTSARDGYRIALIADKPGDAEGIVTRANRLLEASTRAAALAAEKAQEKPTEPLAFADFTWLNGASRQTEFPLDTPAFTGAFMTDANYTYSFANPKDHTLAGSTTSGRTNELQLSHIGFGGDFHWHNMRGRLMTQFGLYATMTPRNDPSPSRGQWDLSNAYRYITEAYGGYHINALHGINVDAGIFMSYVGLCSYYDYENWMYQESYVSANTPWFFNGIRVQLFTSDKLKIEPWLINGWQSYGMFNEQPGLGMQILWRPTDALSFHSNSYFGADVLNNPSRVRFHTDNSVQVKYFDQKSSPLSKGAFSLTFDVGCETGGGVTCAGGGGGPAQSFVGFMAYNRLWFWKDKVGLTLGGGAMNNPGRYLVLLPPINGATATSGTPYFTLNPGDSFTAWDASITLDWMPIQNVTFRWEGNHRESSVPYFAGPGGITPDGGNQGSPGSVVPGFTPDLLKYENRMQFVIMTRL
jgi:hypothetical protein